VPTDKNSLGKDSLEFLIGFSAMSLLQAVGGVSIFSTYQFATTATKGIFSQASEILGGVPGYLITTFGAPYSEELFFFIVVPVITIILINSLALYFKLPILASIPVSQSIVILLTGSLFAAFHLGNEGITAFFIAAFVFRTILLVFQIDLRQELVPIIVTGLLFAIGAHMANNIITTGGIIKFISMLLSGISGGGVITIASILILVTFSIILIAGITEIRRLIKI